LAAETPPSPSAGGVALPLSLALLTVAVGLAWYVLRRDSGGTDGTTPSGAAKKIAKVRDAGVRAIARVGKQVGKRSKRGRSKVATDEMVEDDDDEESEAAAEEEGNTGEDEEEEEEEVQVVPKVAARHSAASPSSSKRVPGVVRAPVPSKRERGTKSRQGTRATRV